MQKFLGLKPIVWIMIIVGVLLLVCLNKGVVGYAEDDPWEFYWGDCGLLPTDLTTGQPPPNVLHDDDDIQTCKAAAGTIWRAPKSAPATLTTDYNAGVDCHTNLGHPIQFSHGSCLKTENTWDGKADCYCVQKN